MVFLTCIKTKANLTNSGKERVTVKTTTLQSNINRIDCSQSLLTTDNCYEVAGLVQLQTSSVIMKPTLFSPLAVNIS